MVLKVAVFVVFTILSWSTEGKQLDIGSLPQDRRVFSRQLATQAKDTVGELKIANSFLTAIVDSTYSIDSALAALQAFVTQRDSELIQALGKIEAAVGSSSDVLKETVAKLSDSVTNAVGQAETSVVNKVDESMKQTGSKLDKLISLVGYGDPYESEIKSLSRS